MSETTPSVCVVGAGIIGSWTALHLAEMGVRTTLIEQFPSPHTRGSSHGMSRAFRFLGDEPIDRLIYSFARWKGLEKEAGKQLYVKTGLLNFGTPDDAYLNHYMGVLRQAAFPFKWLGSSDITARFPMLQYPSGWGATWDPNGGLLLAHHCLETVQNRLSELGGEILEGHVTTISSRVHGANLKLRSAESRFESECSFDRVVVCAGPWTSKLLPDVTEVLSTQLIPVTYWQDQTGDYSVGRAFPILFNARLTGVYAFPSYEYPNLVKVLYHGGPSTDPDRRDSVSYEPYIEKVGHYIREHLPGIDHDRPAILESCLYTMTPDNLPILDYVSESVVVGCGFSGSGFKYAPAAGKMLAALALGIEGELIEGFRLSEFSIDRLSPRERETEN